MTANMKFVRFTTSLLMNIYDIYLFMVLFIIYTYRYICICIHTYKYIFLMSLSSKPMHFHVHIYICIYTYIHVNVFVVNALVIIVGLYVLNALHSTQIICSHIRTYYYYSNMWTNMFTYSIPINFTDLSLKFLLEFIQKYSGEYSRPRGWSLSVSHRTN